MANDNLNIQLQEINKLPKTEDETGLFIVASQEINNNNKAVTYPLKNKADVSYVEKLEKKVKKIEDATTNSKGYYSTEAQLLAAHPSPNVGYTAWVGVPYPGVVYKCETKGIWTKTNEVPNVEEVDLNEYAKTVTEEGSVIRSGKLAQIKGSDATQAISQEAWTDETIAKDKTVLNISQLLGRSFISKQDARNSVPEHLRGIGQILVYKIGLGTGEQSTNFTKTAGQSVKYDTGIVTQTTNDKENMCVTIPLTVGITAIGIRIVITGGDNGGAFYDASGNYISGFRFMAGDGETGDFKIVSIPTNARTCKTTYKVDAYVGTAPKWDYITLYSTGSTTNDIVEYYNAQTISSWSSDYNWEDVKDNNTKNYLIGIRGTDIYTSKTPEVKSRLILNRAIDVNTGAIKEDLTRDISIVYMQPVLMGQHLKLYVDFPIEFETNKQPVIHVYKKETNNNHTRIDTIDWKEGNNYDIINTYGYDIYLSFYTQVTGSGSYPDFNILDTIEATLYERAENNIKRNNGSIILNNIDRLVYAESEIKRTDVTASLLAKLKTGYQIEISGVIQVRAANPSHKIIQMAELSPNTTYKIGGFTNTWEANFPYFFLYNKAANDNTPSIQASKVFTYNDLDDEGVITFTTDSINTKLSMYIAYNGTTFPIFDSENSIRLIKEERSNYTLKDEAGNVIQIVGGSSENLNNLSKISPLQFSAPSGVARVNVQVDSLPAFKGDTKNCILSLCTKDGIFFTKPATIDIQGSTSASNPTYLQKNYSITLFNEDGSECDFKIGDTIFDTDAHLKCDWMESSHHRNIGICNLVYRYNLMKEYPNRFPFEPYYSGYETGARCVVTGFPFEMYINGVWWGIYTWNLRFNRKNFNMKKGNANEILMKCGNSSNPWQESTIQVNDEYWDIKNPSKITDDTKATIMRLFNFLRTQNAATYKTDLKNYMDIDSVLEYFIYVDAFQMIDNFIGNLGLCTYDGIIWYALVYDADTTIGLGFLGQSKTNPTTPLQNEQKYTPSIWFPKLWSAFQDELKVKYADMRKKVLNLESITNEFSNFEKLVGAEIFEKDLKKWATKPANTIPTNANHILTHYKQRLVYLDNKYGFSNQ